MSEHLCTVFVRLIKGMNSHQGNYRIMTNRLKCFQFLVRGMTKQGKNIAQKGQHVARANSRILEPLTLQTTQLLNLTGTQN